LKVPLPAPHPQSRGSPQHASQKPSRPASNATAIRATLRPALAASSTASFFSGESGKNLGLRGGSEEWAMQTAIEDGRADLEQAMGAAR
jgi:hypothetical protein